MDRFQVFRVAGVHDADECDALGLPRLDLALRGAEVVRREQTLLLEQRARAASLLE